MSKTRPIPICAAGRSCSARAPPRSAPGCRWARRPRPTGRIKIGYVSPQTGPLAPFGEADKFVLGGINAALKNGLTIGGKKYSVQIVVRDSQSNPNRAGEVAGELILKEKVDLMVVASTPETTNPVSDQCELNGVPCISTVAPWQPWYIGRQANPGGGPPAWKPFDWTYHFFWGLEDIIAVFTNMWKSLPSNKSIGGLFPNDGDGNAWGDKVVGFPPVLEKMGFKLTDPGRYQNLTQDFSAQIAAFKKANAEIVTGVVIPPDFKTFWTQAAQQGFKPKIVSVGKALLFPPAIEALGDLGDGLTTEVWWSPSPSVQVLAHRRERAEVRRRLRGGDQEAVDAADRLRARAVRGGGGCAQALRRPAEEGRGARRDRRDQAQHHRRTHRLGRRAGEERRQDAAGGRPVGEGQEAQVRAGDRQQRNGEEHPDAGQDQVHVSSEGWPSCCAWRG